MRFHCNTRSGECSRVLDEGAGEFRGGQEISMARAEEDQVNSRKLAPFANQKYLNLESYRKTGKPVCTPMWFAEHDGVLYVYTPASAGKVKRIKNNPQARVMPCNIRGKPKGVWIDGVARVVYGAEAERADKLLTQKYGWFKRVGDFFDRLKERERVVMAIHID